MKKLKSFFTLFLSAVLAASLLPACQNGRYAVPAYEDNKTMIISAWQPFTLSQQSNFDDIRNAGFTMMMPLTNVMNFYGSPTKSMEIMEGAKNAGLKVIVVDKGMSEPNRWITTYVDEYKDHPAFAGLYIKDEPRVPEFEWIAQKREAFREIFPDDKWCYVNLFPSRIQDVGAANYEDYITRYIEDVQPNMLSCDSYPLMADGKIQNDFFFDNEMISWHAKEYGKSIGKKIPVNGFILCSAHDTGGYNYRVPTEAELRWQIAVLMAYGVDGVTYYMYETQSDSGDGAGSVYQDSLLNRYGEKTALYYYAQTVNNEVLAWDHVYLNFKWQGTAAISGTRSNLNPMFLSLKYALYDNEVEGVQSIVSTYDALVGSFKDGKGNPGLMITNATNPMEKITTRVTVKFDKKYSGVIVYEKGVPTGVIPLTANKEAYIRCSSGEGKFVIPVVKK